MKKRAVVAGHICIDITPVFPDGKAESLKEVFIPGKLWNVDNAVIALGGAVSNTGLAMKFFGEDVTLMGKVGADGFGKMALQILKEKGASQGMICDEKSSTSYSVVLAVPGFDRIFLHHPGANDSFCASDLDFEQLSQADLFHFGYPPLMKCMYEKNGEELETIFRQIKKAGTVTSLDMAAVDAASEAGRADWKQILKRTLPWVDVFVPSAEELCFMMDKERYADWEKRAGGEDMMKHISSKEDIRPLAEQAIAMGAGIVLIKCGEKGLYYRTADKQRLVGTSENLGLDVEQWAEKEGFEACYRPDKVLSGTGAGDTCIAAFLSCLLRGYGLEQSIHLAAAAGASCVEAYDALGGLKSLEELQAKIDAGWEKNE